MRPGLGSLSDPRKAAFIFAPSLFLIIALSAAAGQGRKAPLPPDQAVVILVYDGDTVKVRFGSGVERKVRLIGIDSPEIADEREEVRYMAYVAKRFAFLKLYRNDVRLSYDWQREDKYGRLLAFLTLEDGTLFNELILREGFASRFRAFPFEPGLMKRLEAAEAEARRKEKGLWRRADPPPATPAEAAGLLGRLATVRMTCGALAERKPFVVLDAAGGGLEVLVPERRRADFPGLETMTGKTLLVKGLVEEYRGRIQIMADVPLQIRVLPGAK